MKCCKNIYRYSRNKSEPSQDTQRRMLHQQMESWEGGAQTEGGWSSEGCPLAEEHAKGFSSIFECCICASAICAARTVPGEGAFVLHKHWLPTLLRVARRCCFARLLATFSPFSAGHLALLLFCIFLGGSGCVVVLSGIYCFWRQLLHFFHSHWHSHIHFQFLFGWFTSRVLSIFNSLFGRGIKRVLVLVLGQLAAEEPGELRVANYSY